MAPRRASAITLLAISAVPAPGATETAMPISALAHHVAGDGDVAQVVPPAEHDAGGRRVLDHVAGHRGVRLDRDADAAGVARIGARRPLGIRLRMMLPCTTASRPPSLKLVTEMPIAAPSTVLLAISAPSKPNSA